VIMPNCNVLNNANNAREILHETNIAKQALSIISEPKWPLTTATDTPIGQLVGGPI
jgi:hypothetical protein